MHSRVLGERDEAAQATIEAAAKSLGEKLGLDEEALAALTARDRDPNVQAMLRREGVATLLSAVLESELGGAKAGETLLPGRAEWLQEGGFWQAPGDFKAYLEIGGEDQPNKVREILVGDYRDYNEAEDHDLPEGVLLDNAGWEAIVEAPRREAFQLRQQIGELEEGEDPDELKPRDVSFMKERKNHLAEAESLRERIGTLEGDLQALKGEAIEKWLPEGLREKLAQVKGVGPALAETIALALTKAPDAEPGKPAEEA